LDSERATSCSLYDTPTEHFVKVDVFGRFFTLAPTLVPTPQKLDDELDELEDLPPLDRPSGERAEEPTLDEEPAVEVPEETASETEDEQTDALPLDGLLDTLGDEASALGDAAEGPSALDDALHDPLVDEVATSFLGRDDTPLDDGADDVDDEPTVGEDDGGAEGFSDEDTLETEELPPLGGHDDEDSDGEREPRLEY
jgi:hypothetical protein